MAEDLAIGTVQSRQPEPGPLERRATGLLAVILLSCGDTGNGILFTTADVMALPNTPAPTNPAAMAPAGATAPTAGDGLVGTTPIAAPTGPGPSGAPPVGTPGMGSGVAPMTPPPAGAAGAAGAGGAPSVVDIMRAPLACPAGASFCSDFEAAGLPAGTTYVSQRGAFVQGQSLLLDSAQRFSGEQSLLVPADTLPFDYRMLSVAVPGNDFWVRLYVRTDVLFGDDDVDALFLASVLSEGFNGDRAMQLSEQLNQVVLNKNGQLHGAMRENPMPGDPGTRLAAGEWHCLEAFFGGTSGDASVFLAGQPIITAVAWQPETYLTFRFGYQRFTTERNVWMDDVAVALERIGCD